MINPLTVKDHADTLLAAVVDIFADAITTFPTYITALPTRRYVCWGQPSDDNCPYVAVSIHGMGATSPDGRNLTLARASSVGIFSITYNIHIIRDCFPTLDGRNFPPTTAIEDRSEIAAIDMWTLYPELFVRQAGGQLLPGCQEVFIGRCVEQGPRGQFYGITCPVVTEPGLEVALGS